MGKLKSHLSRKNLTNPKWWVMLAYVLVVIFLISPLAIIAFMLDAANDSFDRFFRFINRGSSRSARKIEDCSRK